MKRILLAVVIALGFACNAIAQTPPIVKPIYDKVVYLGNSYILNLGWNVTLTDNDPVLVYTLTGPLPVGLVFDSATGMVSGTATVEGDYFHPAVMQFSATDKDGVSNVMTFRFYVSKPPRCIRWNKQHTKCLD